MKGTGLRRMAIVISICAVVGAVAGIAGSAAAPSKSASQAQKQAQKKKLQAQKQAARKQMRALRQGFRGRFGPGPGPGMMGGPGGPLGPVHGEAVVPNADGTGFVTVTTDGGTLNGVDGTTVDLKEGTDKATYKDSVKIDVGSDAKVIRNHDDAKLSDLKAGDHVRVIQAPKGNIVFAEDDAFIAQEKKEHHGFGHHWGGPPGPPPGAPGAPPAPESGSNQNGSDSGSSTGGGSNS